MTRDGWRQSKATLSNNGRGDCCFLSVMQHRAIVEGIPPRLAQQALSEEGKDPEVQERVRGLVMGCRKLAIVALQNSSDPAIRQGFGGPQTAHSISQIRRLALDYNRDLSNEVDWVNSIGFPGGHADDKAFRLVGETLGIPDLELVREIDVEGETLLAEVGGDTTPLAGRSMVLLGNAHFEVVVTNVSSCHQAGVGTFVA